MAVATTFAHQLRGLGRAGPVRTVADRDDPAGLREALRAGPADA